jgi:O-antigen/teichoic acid export membrane protein
MFSQAVELSRSVHRAVGRAGLDKFATAVMDQVLVSGANFLVGLYLARNFAKSEYGFYVMVVTLSQILISYQNALFNTPLLVRDAETGPGYFRGAERSNTIAVACLVGILVPGALFVGVEAVWSALFFGIFLLKEFRKNLLYARLDLAALLRIDALYLVFMGTCLVLFGIGSWWMVFPLMFAGHALSLAGSGGVQASFPGKRMSMRQVVLENWAIARWTLVGVTATVLQNRSYVYLTSAILSPEVLAELSVARMVMMPLALCVGSSGKIIVVWGRRTLAGGRAELFRRNVAMVAVVLSLLAVCYVCVLLWIYPSLNQAVFHGRYDGLQMYIGLWGGYFLVQMFRFVLSNALQAMQRFKELAVIGVASGLMVPLLCLVLITPFAGNGALVSLICGEALLLAYLGRTFLCSEQGTADFRTG